MEQKLNNEKVGSFHEPAFLFKENILFCVFHKYDKIAKIPMT